MEQKIKRYYELKNQLAELHKNPIGNRIKPDGNLEQRIREKFSGNRAKDILQRTNGFTESNYNSWQQLKSEYSILCDELENLGVLVYDVIEDRMVIQHNVV